MRCSKFLFLSVVAVVGLASSEAAGVKQFAFVTLSMDSPANLNG